MRLAQRFLIPMFTGAGVLHFLTPEPFDTIVPQTLPGSARCYTVASGVAELGIAAGLAYPPTRTNARICAIALLFAVWPANIKMAWDWQKSARPG
ncbi:hypothetical protein GP475_09570 [Corynebacterium poyangense]|uniref:DoxX family protein n=2 Tax=Corynebacterium poyangense TaxID=2684405 RepID=A0A7H0SQN7_9CORY|nr:hypothetical protein [Corynebacterium poyangense]QNQ90862.1 hypothetical protein GP475_09570 [Corynebacterium poyangense]